MGPRGQFDLVGHTLIHYEEFVPGSLAWISTTPIHLRFWARVWIRSKSRHGRGTRLRLILSTATPQVGRKQTRPATLTPWCSEVDLLPCLSDRARDCMFSIEHDRCSPIGL